MSVVLKEVGDLRKEYPAKDDVEMLSLQEYLEMAGKLINHFAYPSVRHLIVGDDDAISYIAHAIMKADWGYHDGMGGLNTWRMNVAKAAIKRYVNDYIRSKKDGPEVLERDDDFNLITVRKRPLHVGDVIQPIDEKNKCNLCLQEDQDNRKKYLKQLLGTLNKRQKECVCMHFLEGMTVEEVGQKLGMTSQGVRFHINKAIEIMRG